jgi:hypothetical protein
MLLNNSMKKLTVLLFLIVVMSSSCTREFICQCTVKYTGNVPGLPLPSTTESVIKNTKSQAKENCINNSTTTTQDGVTMTETCDLY